MSLLVSPFDLMLITVRGRNAVDGKNALVDVTTNGITSVIKSTMLMLLSAMS